MDLILDTCGLLSLAGIAKRMLTDDCLDSIRQADTLYISACSHFEISLKHKRGQLELDDFESPAAFWDACLKAYELSECATTAAHFDAAVHLPDHHADPFDRIIIATAQALDCPIVTYDKRFDAYEVETTH
jgi:PIN domain nuclease of toxin-antitoxin system